MKLGVRCWTDKFAFAIVDGSIKSPKMIEANVVHFPAGLKRPGFLHWITEELKGILRRHAVDSAGFKSIETTARKNTSLLHRAEVEGVVQAVVYETGCHDVSGLNKRQIASRLNEKPDAFSQAINASGLMKQLPRDCEEAVLVAWALLRQ